MSSSGFTQDGLLELKALSAIIQESVAKIDACLAAQKMQFPTSSTPFTLESEAPRNIPEVTQSLSYAVAAAYQFISVARAPTQSILVMAMQHTLPACLAVAVQANVAEICREAGSQGASVKDIAAQSNIDATKLARVLRVLATNHVFLELSPDVFTNNRTSSLLDTGKSVQVLIEKPKEKHVGTIGIAAGVAHCSDDGMKAASYLVDAIFDPKFAKSQEPNSAPLNLAFRVTVPTWEWFELKGNEERHLRFNIAMEGGRKVEPPGLILRGFDWTGLEKDSLVVDVGGGVGSQCMALFNAHKHLRFVVQDRASVVKDALQYWEAHAPEAIKSGVVKLEAHDFFTPQPVKDASVFLLRSIMHDWTDKYCLQILRHLRSAAMPSTRLLLVDNVVPYACLEENGVNVPGIERVVPPSPLLANLGHANTSCYYTDIQMLNMANGKERTVSQIAELMEQAGWKLSLVYQSGPFVYGNQKMVGTPI